MKAEQGEVMVTITVNVAKFDGDGASGRPAEVVERQELVPLSSLPPEMQAELRALAPES